MTLTEHLAELRVRIIRSALAVAIGMIVIVIFYDQVLDFLRQPYVDLCLTKPGDFCPPEDELLNQLNATEGFTTRMRVGMYGGILLALPVILWQVLVNRRMAPGSFSGPSTTSASSRITMISLPWRLNT